MSLKGLNIYIMKNDIKLLAWAIIILAIMTTGCAVSGKKHAGGASANQKNTLVDPNNASPASEDEFADEGFDLIEEELEEKKPEVADPLEPLNRLMFQANDIFYFWILKPVAQTYKGIAPEPARIGVKNFFNNLTTPIRFANCLLQGKGDSAGTELRRFMVNTTVGILGFGDPAKDKYGLEPTDEDLGQTLAVHGFGNGFYLVLPILGPSTLRDTAGFVGDQFLNPVRYVEPTETSIGISAGKKTNETTFQIGEYEGLKTEALDPYIAIRDIYIQYRNKKIQE